MPYQNNTGSTVSRGSKYNGNNGSNMAYMGKGMSNIQNSHSPPSVRNKIHMSKINKNSNKKNIDPHN